GWQRRVLAAGRVTLSVFHGDVAEGLADLQTRQQQPVDAWFLDGFAPDRNPDMWRPDLFTRIADMSRAQSSVTTFTAVGQVRRDLQSAGFTMRRVDQRPHKRESLAGRLMGKPARQPIIPPKRVSVVGGGIAAASTARHLAEQGIGVDLIAPTGLADGASQITSAVCHGRLLGDRSAAADLRAQAFLYSTAYLRQAVGFDGHGVLQVQGPTMDARKLGRISTAYDASNPAQGWVDACTPEQAYQRSGFRPQGDSLWFAQAGAIDLAATTRALVDHPGIEPLTRPTAQDQPEVWCTADAILQVSGCEHLEISTIHGQLDVYRHATNIRAPIVGNGYFVPGAGEITLGATYEYSPWSTARARAHNLDANRPYLNDADLGPAARSIKAARAVSSDRTPIIGPLGDLWLNLAHGSMGATTAPLGAAVIASRLLGWISPVNPAVETVLDPDRFARRQARRGRRHGR
ncbi:MAG: FAD-dependent oxidoreductase, partial [Pseudomonadota bacterium]